MSVDGEALCKWLRPRVAQLTDFDLPLDALHLRADKSVTRQLLDVLPTSLTCFLQSAWTDKEYQGKAGCTLGSLLPSSPAFQSCQDPVPHLSAFARLSALQNLTIPVHQGLDNSALASLKILRDLQRLHLQLRGIGNQAGC